MRNSGILLVLPRWEVMRDSFVVVFPRQMLGIAHRGVSACQSGILIPSCSTERNPWHLWSKVLTWKGMYLAELLLSFCIDSAILSEPVRGSLDYSGPRWVQVLEVLLPLSCSLQTALLFTLPDLGGPVVRLIQLSCSDRVQW